MKHKFLLKTMLLLSALIAGSGSVWAQETQTNTYTFNTTTPSGWTSTATTAAANGYAKMKNGEYVEASIGTLVASGNVLNSDLDVNVSAGTFGTWKGDKQVTVTVSLLNSSNEVLSSDDYTKTSLGNSESSYIGSDYPISVSLPANPSAIAKVRVTFTIPGASDVLRFKYLKLHYTTVDASSDPSSDAAFEYSERSLDLKDAASFTQTATTADGYLGTSGASITYSMTANTAGATINASSGEVTPTKAGSVTVKASAAKVDGSWASSSATYTLTVTDTRDNAELSWSTSSVEIFKNATSYSLPTLNNPNSLEVSYSVTGTEGLASVTDAGVVTVTTSVVGSATVKVIFDGNRTYKPKTSSYTITVIDSTVKGSKYNPFTVAEVIDGTATGNGIYVMGYICGEYQTPSTNVTMVKTSSFSTDANIALADDPTTTALASSIPIQFTKDALKSAWGNQTNAGTTMGYKVIVKGNVDTYFTVNGIKSTSEVIAVSVPVEVSAAGYATFVAKAAVDFTGKAIKAYVAEPNGTTGVTFTQVNKIPANTGVLLYKAGGATEEIPVTTESTDYLGNNVFIPGTGATVATVVETTKHNYILNNGTSGIGFYQANNKKVAKNRAYIQIDQSAGVKEFISLPGFDDDDPTGVETIDNGQLTNDKEIYNLAGQRLNKMQKGINIVNGKKVLF